MQHFFALIVLGLIASGSANDGAAGVSVTPVQKVITLLQGMLQKGQSEKHNEQVQFSQFKQWCIDNQADEKRNIKEETSNIEQLKAEINKLTADTNLLTQKINQDNADITDAEQDEEQEKDQREHDHSDYLVTHEDYEQAIDSIRRAINTLKQQRVRTKAVNSQVSALQEIPLIPAEARKAIETFLMQESEPTEDYIEGKAPKPKTYEFQSSHIIELMEKLLDKFITEKSSLETDEQNAKHGSSKVVTSLINQINLATKDKTEKTETKGKKMQDIAVDTDQKKGENSLFTIDTKDLQDITATCQQRESDYVHRQQLRSEEIETIEKAIQIMKGDVEGLAEKHLPSALLQAKHKKGSVLTQIKSVKLVNPNQARALEYLREKAGQLDSRILSALTVRVADDPFNKVKQMIKDLIVRLMAEANEEAQHKNWCDTELTRNAATRSEKTTELETLSSEIDEVKADIAKLSEEINNLNKALAEIEKEVAEATQNRQQESAENKETIGDCQDAQAAVAQALVVLKEFYLRAGEATAFVQKKQSPYQGMQDQADGVVSFLEIIESDFARLETETSAAETSGQRQYDELMRNAQVEKAAKSTAVEHEAANKQQLLNGLARKKSDLEGTQKELSAATEYYDKLKPTCVDASVSYDTRVERRKEEVESLQNTLKILNGEDA